MSDKALDLRLGTGRYQPKDLQQVMGYDLIARYYVEVELAVLDVFGTEGVMPKETYALLTQEVRESLLSITTFEMDEREKDTKHDIRALVQLMQERMPETLRPWVHVPLTSYDVIDTGRALMFTRAHRSVIRPKVLQVLDILAARIEEHAGDLQIGRTHGQYAVPITFGAWLATIAARIIDCLKAADESADMLVGKIAGPVGAKNACCWLEVALTETTAFGMKYLDDHVGARLGVRMAHVSTQIVPPEPMARYLFNLVLLSGALDQLGTDCRQLMRSEIGEVGEEFEPGQVGSSTMAHKRNPVTFEGLVGAFKKSVGEFVKVLQALVSEHQRDLTDSSVMRDFPMIAVNLVVQLDALLRVGKKNPKPFLARVAFDVKGAKERALQAREFSLAEPLYILLQVAGGYKGDAHHLVNEEIVPRLERGTAKTMKEAIALVAKENPTLRLAWERLSPDTKALFGSARHAKDLSLEPYAGDAVKMSKRVVRDIRELIGQR